MNIFLFRLEVDMKHHRNNNGINVIRSIFVKIGADIMLLRGWDGRWVSLAWCRKSGSQTNFSKNYHSIGLSF